MGFDKELLFRARLPEADVDVPGIGTVRVRALSRTEALYCRDTPDIVTIERRMIALGLVDPELTENEAKRWQENSPAGELEKLTLRISQLSGMTETAAKEAYVAFEQEDGAEFRVLPGAEAGDDGDGPAG
ncbi:MAG TPA: hypothetical protein VK611_21585 [Acidimicrobiales bacterium]|nr:hypothetical protein [Acidimicrobiales bacterium]